MPGEYRRCPALLRLLPRWAQKKMSRHVPHVLTARSPGRTEPPVTWRLSHKRVRQASLVTHRNPLPATTLRHPAATGRDRQTSLHASELPIPLVSAAEALVPTSCLCGMAHGRLATNPLCLSSGFPSTEHTHRAVPQIAERIKSVLLPAATH